jgi:rhomboid family GlyGly-CTERM serine protease
MPATHEHAAIWKTHDPSPLRRTIGDCLQALRNVSITLSLAVVVAAVFAFDRAALLEFSRTEIAAGQWWRVFTGHLTHWSADHLAWDLMMFVVLGAVLERRSRARFLGVLVVSAAAISAAVFWIQPEFELYRGLSGVDSGLFVAVCVGRLADARREKDRLTFAIAIGLLVGLVAKTVFEYATGTTLFVDCAATGFTPLALSHLAGAVAGAAMEVVALTASSVFQNGNRLS